MADRLTNSALIILLLFSCALSKQEVSSRDTYYLEKEQHRTFLSEKLLDLKVSAPSQILLQTNSLEENNIKTTSNNLITSEFSSDFASELVEKKTKLARPNREGLKFDVNDNSELVEKKTKLTRPNREGLKFDVNDNSELVEKKTKLARPNREGSKFEINDISELVENKKTNLANRSENEEETEFPPELLEKTAKEN